MVLIFRKREREREVEFLGGFILYKGRVRNSEDLLALVMFEVGRIIVLIFLEGWRHAVGRRVGRKIHKGGFTVEASKGEAGEGSKEDSEDDVSWKCVNACCP